MILGNSFLNVLLILRDRLEQLQPVRRLAVIVLEYNRENRILSLNGRGFLELADDVHLEIVLLALKVVLGRRVEVEVGRVVLFGDTGLVRC